MMAGSQMDYIFTIRFEFPESKFHAKNYNKLKSHGVGNSTTIDLRIGCTERGQLKGHCIEFKYYADGIHSGLTPPG